jgi:uncharacterized protein (TIGR02271 family)
MPQTVAKPVERGWTTDSQLEEMLGYNVEDSQGNRIGHVSGLWVNAQNDVEFVGVKTTWLVGKTHVFPADGMDVNHHREIIRAPYSLEAIKNAPAFDPGSELTASEQQQIFSYYQGYRVPREAPRAKAAGQSREEARVPLTEEQLKVGKRQVEAGGVRLRKIVRTEPAEETVQLNREEAVIKRVPAEGSRAPAKAFEREDIYVPLRREEAVVQKEARVREEVRLSKTSHSEQQKVSEQLRKEDVEVENTGDSRIHTSEGAPANRIREQQEKPRSQRQHDS